jgi:hypothetical protein
VRRPIDTIDVVDPTGAIYTAIYGNLNIVVMDFDAPAVEPVATGTWTDVYYSELDDYTVFEDTSASFSTTVSVGDLIQPDTAQPSVWVTVSSVLSNTELAVDGDVTETSAPLVPYRVTDPIWSYSSGVSTYTNNSANFEDWMLGWLFTPDVNEPCYLQVIEVTSATSIKVKGDARGLSQPDDQWRIHAPPGVDNTTGGLHTDLTEAGSRYLYGTMRYMPPQAGFDVSSTIYGAQPGVYLSGWYHDSGIYDVSINVYFAPSFNPTLMPTVFIFGWLKDLMDRLLPPETDAEDGLGKDWDKEREAILKEAEEADDAIDEAVRVPKQIMSDREGAIGLAKKYNEDRGEWWKTLPPCPCENPDLAGGIANREGKVLGKIYKPNPDDGWASEGKNPLHPGSFQCFRSYPHSSNNTTLDGPGQQCCYDEGGKLIKSGPGAGTPDRVNTAAGENADGSVDVHIKGLLGHAIEDVEPFGKMGWEEYVKYWPPNQGLDCD